MHQRAYYTLYDGDVYTFIAMSYLREKQSVCTGQILCVYIIFCCKVLMIYRDAVVIEDD